MHDAQLAAAQRALEDELGGASSRPDAAAMFVTGLCRAEHYEWQMRYLQLQRPEPQQCACALPFL